MPEVVEWHDRDLRLGGEALEDVGRDVRSPWLEPQGCRAMEDELANVRDGLAQLTLVERRERGDRRNIQLDRKALYKSSSRRLW
jgi:hypothetical protein